MLREFVKLQTLLFLGSFLHAEETIANQARLIDRAGIG